MKETWCAFGSRQCKEENYVSLLKALFPHHSQRGSEYLLYFAGSESKTGRALDIDNSRCFDISSRHDSDCLSFNEGGVCLNKLFSTNCVRKKTISLPAVLSDIFVDESLFMKTQQAIPAKSDSHLDITYYVISSLKENIN